MINPNLIIGKRNALNNWLRQFTTFVDIDNRLYKIQESLMGIFKWGDFKKLPDLNYVLLFRSFYAKCEACSLDDEKDDAFYQVSLVHNKNRRIIVHETKNYGEALQLAQKMAGGFNLKLKNSAVRK